MEQMYLIEIFVDKVTIFASEEDEKSGANKNLIVKIKFGPKVQFIIKEGQMSRNDDPKDDIIDCDDQGRRKWTRTIRVGKSYLFPSYPDTVMMILNKFPLEIEVWNDDDTEVEIFVGVGSMIWETQFFHMLKDATAAHELHDPLAIKQVTPLFGECYCKQVGEIAFILRLSALGESIITEFQQLMKDPDAFVFRTNKAPSMFKCTRIEGDDPNFCMVGSLYETTTLEDPDVAGNAEQKIEICTELQSCGVGKGATVCEHEPKEDESKKKRYPIEKIRMGDITGPCGNTNCPLAHKVRAYIRNLDTYKAVAGNVTGTKEDATNKVCGACSCKDDRWHREDCPTNQLVPGQKAVCKGCGGVVPAGQECSTDDNGGTKTGNETKVGYVSVTTIPNFKESIYGKAFTIENMTYNQTFNHSGCDIVRSASGYSLRNTTVAPAQTITTHPSSHQNTIPPQFKPSTRSLGTNNPWIYNVETMDTKRVYNVYNVCTDIPDDKECKCSPPKPTPPCRTFDCDCLAETSNIAARKTHKPYCPSYKHKNNCPVTMMHEEEERKNVELDEEENEPLPYGLPPIALGPCPVLGRPCTVPDGFARMYKTAAMAPQPPSYSDAGKICCSKEYERIKKAIKEYMKSSREHDFRCVNKFNVDTERRCCDKEQMLLSLMGKGCCGSHKMDIQEKFKEDKK